MIIDTYGKVAHYTRLENLANILHDKKIKLSNVSGLNDIRENSLSWIDVIGIGHNTPHSHKDSTDKLIRTAGNRIKIFCCAGEGPSKPGLCQIESSIYGRPRMWAQYGGNSQGFCVILNKENLNESIKASTEKSEYVLAGKINYLHWNHIINNNIEIEYADYNDNFSQALYEKISPQNLQSIYFKKGEDWEHEHEYRWLVLSDEETPIFISIENLVEAVVLGCQFPNNQVSQVQSYCKSLGCKLYKLSYTHPKYEITDLTVTI